MSSTDAAKIHEAAMLLVGKLKHFIGPSQRLVLRRSLQGEEGMHFANLLIDLGARIDAMPGPYGQDGKGEDAIVYLHYFRGSADAWITEKDAMPGEHEVEQEQAFGKVNLFGTGIGEAELGYVSIRELIEHGVELDLYWDPKPIHAIKG